LSIVLSIAMAGAKKHTAPAPTSKVVPKKSATAKPVAKSGPKNKKVVTDTDSEMGKCGGILYV
jgi:hypothetical protein